MNGTVFSIEEFSTYDGPGIRTTVFMKGCPLRCSWCHNPEGQLFESQLVRSPNGCLGCGKCLDAGEKACGKRILTDESISACERRLIRRCGMEYTPEALVGSLSKNFRLLNMAGGGVTFSGGEVLAQSDFVRECLCLLRGNAHRAVQTAGYGGDVSFRGLLSECDLVLYDLKLINAELHRKYTGCGNEPVIRNFLTLAGSGIPFVVRVPLIPTVTDTVENITSIASLMRENGAGLVELMPYNKLAGGKYAMVGRHYEPGFPESVPVCTHEEIFRSFDIDVKVM